MKLNHLFIPYLALLAFLLGGIVTSGGVTWYRTLSLPLWHPSEALITFIWAAIYALAAWSLLIVWNKTGHDKRHRVILGGFIGSLILNLLWSLAFFGAHQFGASVFLALLLGAFVLSLMALIYPRSKKAAILLLPYVAWVLFAAYLTAEVMGLNM